MYIRYIQHFSVTTYHLINSFDFRNTKYNIIVVVVVTRLL